MNDREKLQAHYQRKGAAKPKPEADTCEHPDLVTFKGGPKGTYQWCPHCFTQLM